MSERKMTAEEQLEQSKLLQSPNRKIKEPSVWQNYEGVSVPYLEHLDYVNNLKEQIQALQAEVIRLKKIIAKELLAMLENFDEARERLAELQDRRNPYHAE